MDQEKRRKIYRQLEKELCHNYEDVIGAVAFRKVAQDSNNDMWIAERTRYSRSHPLWFENGDLKKIEQHHVKRRVF